MLSFRFFLKGIKQTAITIGHMITYSSIKLIKVDTETSMIFK